MAFQNQNFTKSYSESSSTITITGASNGTGSYTYSEVSEKNSNSTSTNYITISGTTITLSASTPVSTYTYVVRVADGNSGKTKDATMTITIDKVDATCPTLTAYSGTYDGAAHSITVSVGSGGTIQYRTSTTGAWGTTKPSITNVSDSPMTTYVQVYGDSNHNTKDCGSKTVTLTKKADTVSITAKSAGYTGDAIVANTATSESGSTITYVPL